MKEDTISFPNFPFLSQSLRIAAWMLGVDEEPREVRSPALFNLIPFDSVLPHPLAIGIIQNPRRDQRRRRGFDCTDEDQSREYEQKGEEPKVPRCRGTPTEAEALGRSAPAIVHSIRV